MREKREREKCEKREAVLLFTVVPKTNTEKKSILTSLSTLGLRSVFSVIWYKATKAKNN